MDDSLRSAAERIARPCVLLKRSGPADALAAVWGGRGIVPAPEGAFRHWISVDCRFLPAGAGLRSGVLSVYTDEDGEDGFVGHDPGARLTGAEGTPLYAHPARSLPPPIALDAEDDDAYTRVYQSSCPLYSDADDVAAVLGGWHFAWPDDDWHDLRERPLLVWTLEDSEPWVEAWGGPEGFQVIQRIT